MLSREEWDIYHRTIGGFARTYTEQQAVGREELDASTAIKQIDFAMSDNCVWSVLYTAESVVLESAATRTVFLCPEEEGTVRGAPHGAVSLL